MTKTENNEVHIRTVISEHRRRPGSGLKRVMAIVSKSPNSRHTVTRHVDTRDGITGTLGQYSAI